MDKIDFKDSKLILDGTKKERKEKGKEIGDIKESLKPDRDKRRALYKKRWDFYTGKHDYTNIIGKTLTAKKGHPNAVFNYAGKTAKKITYGLANNPPNITFPNRNLVSADYVEDERIRSQGVEDFVDDVLDKNNFWLKAYRRACMNQVTMGDAAIKCYPVKDGDEWVVKITNLEKMDNLMVAWRGDDVHEYDAVIVEEERTLRSIEDEFGIKIPEKMAHTTKDKDKATGNSGSAWAESKQWDGSPSLAMGETKAPSVTLVEYDDKDYYCLMVGSEMIQYVEKDDVTYPKVPFWTIIHNIPQPRSPWSISDLDDMMDPQIEFNEASNEERSYIRVGANQRYVAVNMEDFDPESIKTGSGGVIFVDSPDGSARFEPLQSNVNTFPVDSYINRVRDTLYDMGVPKVTFGAGGADSGRSKAIDYQSLVELIDAKHKAWELALREIFKKIQLYGDFYYGETEIFQDPSTKQFVVRNPDFDWVQVMPITKSDEIVNVLNKVQMGLPFRYAFRELGYRDVDAIIEEMKRETKDPELMEYRAKMYQVTQGLVQAQKRANELLQAQEAGPPAGAVNQSTPTMVPSQGGEGMPQPASVKGGTTSFSSPQGFIERTRQNLQAGGK